MKKEIKDKMVDDIKSMMKMRCFLYPFIKSIDDCDLCSIKKKFSKKLRFRR